MIVVAELQCTGFSHEAFNAGTLYDIRKAFPAEKIIFFCEEEQGDCVEDILNKETDLTDIIFEKISTERFLLDSKGYFCEYLEQIKEKKMVLITGFGGNTISEVIDRFKDVEFYVYQHGILEYLVNREPIKVKKWYIGRIRRDIERVKESLLRPENAKVYLADLSRLHGYDNYHMIVFSSVFFEYDLKEYNFLKNNAILISLPYAFRKNVKKRNSGSRIWVGVAASSIDDNYHECREIIDSFNREIRKTNVDVRFVVLNYTPVPKIDNMSRYLSPDKSRESIVKFYEKIDWLLIPYGEDKYVISTSGAVYDAIDSETPVIMYASKCFEDFVDKGIGIRNTDKEGLAKDFTKIVKDYDYRSKYALFVENIRKFKNENKVGNAKLFRSMLDMNNH